MEIQSLITPLRNRIALMIQTNSRELTTTQSEISSVQQAIQTFDQSVRQQEDCIESLEARVNGVQVVRVLTGVAVTQSLFLPFKFTDILASLNCRPTLLLLAWQLCSHRVCPIHSTSRTTWQPPAVYAMKHKTSGTIPYTGYPTSVAMSRGSSSV